MTRSNSSTLAQDSITLGDAARGGSLTIDETAVAQKMDGGDKCGKPRILTVPYPIEECGASLVAQHPDQLGLFVAGRQKNYAFRANKNSVELAVNHLGYRVYNYARPDDPDAEAAALEQLASALADDAAQLKLSFVFLKPRLLAWKHLGNCLVFEPYHLLSLIAADKWNMAVILRSRSRLLAANLRDANGDPFHYSRFCMYTTNPAYYQKSIIKHLDENPGVYVLKRTNSSQGLGIHMYHARGNNTVEKLQQCVGANARLSHFVLQKYIERPLLVDKRKFDLRVYMLVLNCSCPQRPGERGYFAFCHPGYVKVSSRPYMPASQDPRVHFTNQFVQRRTPATYAQVKEATTWLPDELSAYLDRRRYTEAGWCRERMYRQVRAITGYLAAACRPHLRSQRPGCLFRIYGLDLIVDEELRVRLLEFNCFPCYAKNTVALAASVSGMWCEAIAVATEAAVHYRGGLPLREPRLPVTGRSFSLVYSSENLQVLRDLVRSAYP